MITIKYMDTSYNENVYLDRDEDNVVLRLIKYAVNNDKTYGIYIGHRGFPTFDMEAIEKQFYAT